MEPGMLVLRKSDARKGIDAVGVIVEVGQWTKGERARVKWLDLGYRTWVSTAQLVEVSDEQRKRYEQRR